MSPGFSLITYGYLPVANPLPLTGPPLCRMESTRPKKPPSPARPTQCACDLAGPGGRAGQATFRQRAKRVTRHPAQAALASERPLTPGPRSWTLNGPAGHRVTSGRPAQSCGRVFHEPDQGRLELSSSTMPGPQSCYGSDQRSFLVMTCGQAMTPAPLPVYQPASFITLPSANT